jgi:hypothetical protein
VQLQLPFMRTPFGFSAFTDKKTLKMNYSLDLSFDADDVEAQVVLKKFTELDNLMLKTVTANSKAWLGDDFDEASLRKMLMSPIPKKSKKGDYAPTLKLKIAVDPKTDAIIPEVCLVEHEFTSFVPHS